MPSTYTYACIIDIESIEVKKCINKKYNFHKKTTLSCMHKKYLRHYIGVGKNVATISPTQNSLQMIDEDN